MAALLLLLLLLLGLWGWLRTSAREPSLAPRWPPGPRPLPLLGNLPSLRPSQQDQWLMELSGRYGPVFTVYLGGQRTVVLSGHQAVRAALVGTGLELADRPPIPIFQCIQQGGGIFFSSGERWRAARRFTVRTLHILGAGQGLGARTALEELGCLVELLDHYRGRPFPLALLGWAPSNVTFTLLFGQRFDYQDPMFRSLLGLIDEVMVLLGSPSLQLFNLYPRMGALLGLHQPVLRKIEEVRAILRTLLQARRPVVSRGGPVRSYMDALIQQGQVLQRDKLFAEPNAVACMLDMLMAGTETTSATLQWAALLLAKHPGVQRRAQEELGRLLGVGGRPRPEDQQRLPYTCAVLHEVQRYITLLPHVPRCTATRTQLGGYLLPKGTPVIPLLTSVLLDKTQWATPDQFNPGHFLDADGRFVKPAAFLPFSAGRRVCVGESLARTELFLLLAGLLQKYYLRPPPGVSPAALDTTPAPAFTMRPRAQALCVVPRAQPPGLTFSWAFTLHPNQAMPTGVPATPGSAHLGMPLRQCPQLSPCGLQPGCSPADTLLGSRKAVSAPGPGSHHATHGRLLFLQTPSSPVQGPWTLFPLHPLARLLHARRCSVCRLPSRRLSGPPDTASGPLAKLPREPITLTSLCPSPGASPHPPPNPDRPLLLSAWLLEAQVADPARCSSPARLHAYLPPQKACVLGRCSGSPETKRFLPQVYGVGFAVAGAESHRAGVHSSCPLLLSGTPTGLLPVWAGGATATPGTPGPLSYMNFRQMQSSVCFVTSNADHYSGPPSSPTAPECPPGAGLGGSSPHLCLPCGLKAEGGHHGPPAAARLPLQSTQCCVLGSAWGY
ncbi:cytochrome P450 2W1 [Ctenodactylus gundi]